MAPDLLESLAGESDGDRLVNPITLLMDHRQL